MRMVTERSNNTDFDHACLNPHFYLRPSHMENQSCTRYKGLYISSSHFSDMPQALPFLPLFSYLCHNYVDSRTI